mgnify:CR=1 FL=1
MCLCAGKGAVVVRYHSGEAFDVALCGCQIGARLRSLFDRNQGLLEAYFGVGSDRIWPLEQLNEEPVSAEGPTGPPSEISEAPAFVQATRRPAKKARL